MWTLFPGRECRPGEHLASLCQFVHFKCTLEPKFSSFFRPLWSLSEWRTFLGGILTLNCLTFCKICLLLLFLLYPSLLSLCSPNFFFHCGSTYHVSPPFFFWPCLRHSEVPGPGMEPTAWQWQHRSFNPLHPQGTPPSPFLTLWLWSLREGMQCLSHRVIPFWIITSDFPTRILTPCARLNWAPPKDVYNPNPSTCECDLINK